VAAVLATAAPSQPAQPSGIDQIHLSYLGDARYALAWASSNPIPSAHVRFWAGAEGERRVAKAQTFSWGRRNRKRSGQVAVLDELGPGLRVGYVVADSSGDLSAARQFHTEPPAGQPFRLIAWGDLGTHEASASSVAMALADAPSLLLHAGDLAYAGGDQRIWDRWFRMIEPLAATVPYMPAPGNHEYEGRRGCATYRARFHLPGNERYYSLAWGSVDLVFLDSEEDLAPGSPQHTFLSESLARIDLAPGRWKIVVLHRPLWSSSRHGSNRRIARALTPLLHRYDVDLVLAGHDHNFERAWPLWGRKVLRPSSERSWGSLGFDHLVTGTAGRPTYTGGYSEFTAHQVSRIHYTRIEVAAEELRMEAVAVPGGEVFHAWQIAAPWSDCPALSMAAGIPDGHARLPALRHLRDEILAPLPRGQALVGDYYRFGAEAIRLLEADPSRARAAAALLVEIGEGVGAKGADWVPGKALRARAAELARQLAAAASAGFGPRLDALARSLDSAPADTDLAGLASRIAAASGANDGPQVP